MGMTSDTLWNEISGFARLKYQTQLHHNELCDQLCFNPNVLTDFKLGGTLEEIAEDEENVRKATSYLTNVVLPKFTQDLCTLKHSIPVSSEAKDLVETGKVQLAEEAVNYIQFGITVEQNPRFQHRRSSYKELQYISDGDSNGALYFAGTSYGEHHWVNPVLSKRIAISASSPTSRFTDPKVLASRTYQGTSFAGHRIENGEKCSWWIVDLGEGHQLMCNYYTVRQDGSRAFIRYWTLQGSMDGKIWTNLRVHENDNRICKPGQFASWAVSGESSLLPFRFFRVMLNGPTTDFVDPWKLCICFIELYGYFH